MPPLGEQTVRIGEHLEQHGDGCIAARRRKPWLEDVLVDLPGNRGERRPGEPRGLHPPHWQRAPRGPSTTGGGTSCPSSCNALSCGEAAPCYRRSPPDCNASGVT